MHVFKTEGQRVYMLGLFFCGFLFCLVFHCCQCLVSCLSLGQNVHLSVDVCSFVVCLRYVFSSRACNEQFVTILSL